jgi:hypothetical protein
VNCGDARRRALPSWEFDDAQGRRAGTRAGSTLSAPGEQHRREDERLTTTGARYDLEVGLALTVDQNLMSEICQRLLAGGRALGVGPADLTFRTF